MTKRGWKEEEGEEEGVGPPRPREARRTHQVSLGQEDVARLDVAMQHTLAVDKLERHADLRARTRRKRALVRRDTMVEEAADAAAGGVAGRWRHALTHAALHGGRTAAAAAGGATRGRRARARARRPFQFTNPRAFRRARTWRNQSKTSSSSNVSFARSRRAMACCSEPPEQYSMMMCSTLPITKEPRYSVMLTCVNDLRSAASFCALTCSSGVRCSKVIFFATNRSPLGRASTRIAQQMSRSQYFSPRKCRPDTGRQ